MERGHRAAGGLCAAALLLGACNGSVDITPPRSRPTSLPTSPSWHGPNAIDLGDARDASAATFYSTHPTSDLAVTAGTAVSTSFAGFRLSATATAGALLGSFYDGVNFRALGRVYAPRSQGGAGWAPYGPRAGFLDTGATSYLDLAGGFSPTGLFLALFHDGVAAATARQASYGIEGAWTGFSGSFGATTASIPESTPLENAYRTSVAWDPQGNAYYGYVSTTTEGYVHRATALTDWDSTGMPSSSASGSDLGAGVTQIELLNDGFGMTAFWLGTVATPHTGRGLRTMWSADGFATPQTLSLGDVKAMAAATDGQGTVLAVYVGTDPGYVTPIAPPAMDRTIRGNDSRVFAVVRGASGIWSGPTRLDDASRFDTHSTTVYQDSFGMGGGTEAAGGIDWPTPAVAYVGGGRFLVAFPVTDLLASPNRSSIVVRGYAVGVGWDAAGTEALELDSLSLPSGNTEAFRFANDLKLASDGQGNAVLVAQVAVVTSGTGATNDMRAYAFKTYRYSAGSWGSPYTLPNSRCRAPATLIAPLVPTGLPDRHYCWNLKAEVAVFPGGETVIAYPAPAAASGTLSDSLRLFSMEYSP